MFQLFHPSPSKWQCIIIFAETPHPLQSISSVSIIAQTLKHADLDPLKKTIIEEWILCPALVGSHWGPNGTNCSLWVNGRGQLAAILLKMFQKGKQRLFRTGVPFMINQICQRFVDP